MSAIEFEALLGRMTRAICAGDGAGAAACFAPQGVYHDGFYGGFKGRDEIARMVSVFHRDGRDFRWKLADALSDGRAGYARYEFSYVSKLPGAEGRPAGFSGTCFCALEGAPQGPLLILRYEEQFERAPVLAQLGFPDERILKSVRRWAGPAPG